MNNSQKVIFAIVVIAVAAIAIGGFLISYDTLKSVASEKFGFGDWQSKLYPLIIDLSIVVFAFANLYSVIAVERRNKWATTLVVISTLVSVGFNALFKEGIAIVGHIIPPLMLAAAFEFLMMIWKQRAKLVEEQNQEAVNSAQAELKSIQAEVKSAKANVKSAKEQLKLAQEEIEKAKAKVIDFRQQPKKTQAIYLRSKFPNMPKKDIASAVGVSAGMVTRYLSELQ